MGEKEGENVGENVGEKTGENGGECLGEIDKLNLCQKSVTSLSFLSSNIHYWGCSKQ